MKQQITGPFALKYCVDNQMVALLSLFGCGITTFVKWEKNCAYKCKMYLTLHDDIYILLFFSQV